MRGGVGGGGWNGMYYSQKNHISVVAVVICVAVVVV